MNKTLALSASALALCSIAPAVDAATTLSIDGTNTCTYSGNRCLMLQTYGDTASVDVTYESISSSGTALGAAHDSGTNFGDLGHVLVAGSFRDGTRGQLTLKARDGYAIRLLDFDFAGYFNFAPILPLQVLDLRGNELMTGSFGTGNGSTHSNLAVNSAFLSGIVIRWGPDSSVGGIDNIRYDTRPLAASVPEPATWAMMIGGLGFAGAAKRRARVRIRPATSQG